MCCCKIVLLGVGMNTETLESIQNLQLSEQISEIDSIIDKLDFIDIQILRKFYTTGKEFPLDTQPYCFPLLYQELKTTQRLRIGREALRKRLNNLVNLGLLIKVRHSNPTSYTPVSGREMFVRSLIIRFFVIHGLTKFL